MTGDTRQGLTEAQRELDDLALAVVDVLEGTGRLPMPSPRFDRLIAEGYVKLSTPRGLSLTDAGREVLSRGGPE